MTTSPARATALAIFPVHSTSLLPSWNRHASASVPSTDDVSELDALPRRSTNARTARLGNDEQDGQVPLERRDTALFHIGGSAHGDFRERALRLGADASQLASHFASAGHPPVSLPRLQKLSAKVPSHGLVRGARARARPVTRAQAGYRPAERCEPLHVPLHVPWHVPSALTPLPSPTPTFGPHVPKQTPLQSTLGASRREIPRTSSTDRPRGPRTLDESQGLNEIRRVS